MQNPEILVSANLISLDFMPLFALTLLSLIVHMIIHYIVDKFSIEK